MSMLKNKFEGKYCFKRLKMSLSFYGISETFIKLTTVNRL